MSSITSWYLWKTKLDKADSAVVDVAGTSSCEVASGKTNVVGDDSKLRAESRKIDIITSTYTN